ncbi:hypothetical protein [Pseudomonas sp. GL-R-26]|uniref:hypothetical protein n=1 Tax=Pseudomonas sp. GL-R-26 TaxID=2832392 RepID=UPI001CBB16A9|nr:hypothetical protein [Pseudomonas sp. GL-R-26]
MKKIIKHYLLFVCCVSANVYACEVDLCKADEMVIASCRLSEAKGRVVSFCASANKKTISYRVGSNSDLEMNIQFSNKKPVSRWLDVGTYTTYFGFRRAAYSYVLGVPQESLGARAFLEVAKNDKILTSVDCVDNSYGEKNIDSEAIINVQDDLVRSNGFLFPPY